MKIEGGQIQNSLLDVNPRDRAGRVGPGEGEEGDAVGEEGVAWSARLGRLRELGREVGDVHRLDHERVDALRAALAAGAYAPSVEGVAGALFGEIASGGA